MRSYGSKITKRSRNYTTNSLRGIMYESLLAFGPLFWIFLAAWIILSFAFVENEIAVLPGIAFAAFIGLTQAFTHMNPLGLIVENKGYVVAFALLYLVVGMFWSMFKWYLFSKRSFEKLNEKFKGFLVSAGLGTDTSIKLTDEQKAKWKTYQGYGDKVTIPLVTQNKAKIMGWMAYWPFSCIFFLFSDLFRSVFESIYYQIAGFFQAITDRIYSGVDKDNFK